MIWCIHDLEQRALIKTPADTSTSSQISDIPFGVHIKRANVASYLKIYIKRYNALHLINSYASYKLILCYYWMKKAV